MPRSHEVDDLFGIHNGTTTSPHDQIRHRKPAGQAQSPIFEPHRVPLIEDHGATTTPPTASGGAAHPSHDRSAGPIIVRPMRSDRALAELKELREAAATPEVQCEGAAHDGWKAKVIVVMRQVLGDQSTTLDQFTNHRYTVDGWTGWSSEYEGDRRYFTGL
jgi:hypothetical protein